MDRSLEQTVPRSEASSPPAAHEAGEASLVPAGEPLPPRAPVGPAPAPGRRRLRLSLVLGLAGILAAASGAVLWYWFSTGETPVPYKTVLVDRGPVTAMVTATGTVNPVVSVLVGSQVSGKIIKLFADYNSEVTEGQLIAQIDPQPFQARVSQARAGLLTAQSTLDRYRANLDQRKLELDRMARLRREGFVSQADLDLARTNHRDALAQVGAGQATVDQAQAALDNAELDLQYTKIYSPVDGIVVSRNVDVGQTVAASFQTPTLFVIAQDLTKMQVDANVSESDIGGVTEGHDAEFTVDAYPTQPFKGTVTQVRNAPISIQNVVTYDVVIGVDNRELKLKPGMTANVSIVTAHRDDVLRVPNAALRFKLPGAPATGRPQPAVWMLGADSQPRRVVLKPGIADGVYTEVTESDLREGDRVIVSLAAPEGAAGSSALPPGFAPTPRMR